MRTFATLIGVGFVAFAMFFMHQTVEGGLAANGVGYVHYLLAAMPALGTALAGFLIGMDK